MIAESGARNNIAGLDVDGHPVIKLQSGMYNPAFSQGKRNDVPLKDVSCVNLCHHSNQCLAIYPAFGGHKRRSSSIGAAGENWWYAAERPMEADRSPPSRPLLG